MAQLAHPLEKIGTYAYGGFSIVTQFSWCNIEQMNSQSTSKQRV